MICNMKFTKVIALAAAALTFFPAVSSATLLLTFTEENDNVLVRTSGSLSLTDASFLTDGRTALPTTAITSSSIAGNDPGIFDLFTGVDLLDTPLSTNIIFGSSFQNSFADGFAINGANLSVFGDGTIVALDDDLPNITAFSAARILVFFGVDFETLGVDHHQKNIDIGLWRASAGAGEAGTINFRLEDSAVPEPSPLAFFACGLLDLFLRRRRR